MEVPQKAKLELPQDAGILLRDVYVKDSKSAHQGDTCTYMLNATVFTIAKIWNQSSCPQRDEKIKKMWVYIEWKFTQLEKRLQSWCFQEKNGSGDHYAKQMKPDKSRGEFR